MHRSIWKPTSTRIQSVLFDVLRTARSIGLTATDCTMLKLESLGR